MQGREGGEDSIVACAIVMLHLGQNKTLLQSLGKSNMAKKAKRERARARARERLKQSAREGGTLD